MTATCRWGARGPSGRTPHLGVSAPPPRPLSGWAAAVLSPRYSSGPPHSIPAPGRQGQHRGGGLPGPGLGRGDALPVSASGMWVQEGLLVLALSSGGACPLGRDPREGVLVGGCGRRGSLSPALRVRVVGHRGAGVGGLASLSPPLAQARTVTLCHSRGLAAPLPRCFCHLLGLRPGHGGTASDGRFGRRCLGLLTLSLFPVRVSTAVGLGVLRRWWPRPPGCPFFTGACQKGDPARPRVPRGGRTPTYPRPSAPPLADAQGRRRPRLPWAGRRGLVCAL